jgi:hypothetical protein
MQNGVTLDYEDALDNALVVKNITGGKKFLKLIDARSDFSITKEAQGYINEMDRKQTLARAVVKGSAFSNLMINFFSSLSKPEIATRIFTDYEEAYKWLMTYKTRHEDPL